MQELNQEVLAVIPFVVGLVQLLKMSIGSLEFTIGGRTVNTAPVTAVILGVVFGFVFVPSVDGVINGLTAALVGMGLWSGTKAIVGTKE